MLVFQVLSQQQSIFLGGGKVTLEKLSAWAENRLLAVVLVSQDQGYCNVDQDEFQALLVAIVQVVVWTHPCQDLVQEMAMGCQLESKVLLVELLIFVRCW